MAYVTSPYAPKARRLAVQDVRTRRLSISQAADKYGVHRATIYRWCKHASHHPTEWIHNKQSVPKKHSNALAEQIVEKIIAVRKETGRCAPVIHELMLREGYSVS